MTFVDSAHELLVRCLARAGQLGAARHHANACEVLFRRELGRAPDARVRRAADDPGSVPAVGDRAAALGQLEAGRAALDAGAVEPGIACLRLACAEARAVEDPVVLAEALAALGTALVHAVRGRDEEGAAVLREALALAQEAGDRSVATKASRELGFVEVQAGRSVSAGRWLLEAQASAQSAKERAAVLGVRGMALSDRAHYEASIALLSESVASARECGDLRQAAWSQAVLGRALLLRGQLPEAVEALDDALVLVGRERWIAFRPFPEALRAEVALRQDHHDEAVAMLDQAFSLGCRLGDPCWEALCARARGLAHEAAGERGRALACLRDAVTRAVRVADPYVWIHAHCLDALIGLEIVEGASEAHEHVAVLEQIAGRGDMRELVVRAALHRWDLGDRFARDAVRLLSEAIDNPALHLVLPAVA